MYPMSVVEYNAYLARWIRRWRGIAFRLPIGGYKFKRAMAHLTFLQNQQNTIGYLSNPKYYGQ